jgi:hypothetical protein
MTCEHLSGLSIFSVVWIFIGNFIITNLFIGVIVQNLDEATEEERVQRDKEKSKRFSRRKSAILARQVPAPYVHRACFHVRGKGARAGCATG